MAWMMSWWPRAAFCLMRIYRPSKLWASKAALVQVPQRKRSSNLCVPMYRPTAWLPRCRCALQNIVERLLSGDRRALARMVTLIENEVPAARRYLAELHQYAGHAHIVGVTGAPGAGKSTLVTRLVRELRRRDRKVGVVAVDPTSPFTGGGPPGGVISLMGLSRASHVLFFRMGTPG